MEPLNQAEIRQARVDLAAALRMANRQGLSEGICNHFSMDIGGGRFLVNPLGLHWSELTASSLLIADFDGNVVDGEALWTRRNARNRSIWAGGCSHF